jgi:Domain of unknown function (DUF5658)
MIGNAKSKHQVLATMRNLMPHPVKLLLFTLLSVADLTVTWWLLGNSDGDIYEANPIARFWLQRYGSLGLAGFKVSLILLTTFLIVIVARSRPRAAGRLLGFGCVCLTLVVSYSAALYLVTIRPALAQAPDTADAVKHTAKFIPKPKPGSRAYGPQRQTLRAG